MLNDNKHIQDFFKEGLDELNTHQMPVNHEHRFLERLDKKNKVKKHKLPFMGVAASVILLVCFFFWNTNDEIGSAATQEVVAYPQEVQDAHQYYDGIIMKELAKLKSLENSNNSMLISDTVSELKKLKQDEDELLKQLSVSYNERIVKALIDNFQIRINLLEAVMQKVKNINNENENYQNDKI